MNQKSSPRRRSMSLDDALPNAKRTTTKSDAIGDELPDGWFDFKPVSGDFMEQPEELVLAGEPEGNEVGLEGKQSVREPLPVPVEAPSLASSADESKDFGDDIFEIDAPIVSAASALEEAASNASAADDKDLFGDFDASKSSRGKHAASESSSGYIAPLDEPLKTKKADPDAKRRRGIIAAVVAVCVVALAGLGFAFANGMLGPAEEQTLVASDDSRRVNLGGTSTFIVNAEGYDGAASPIVYHITGTTSESSTESSTESGSSAAAETIDRYGFLSTEAAKSKNAPKGAFEVVLDDLPKGAYTLSWSNAILSDGSYYQVPEPMKFTVGNKDVRMEVTFVRVDGSTANALDVKTAYDSLVDWTSAATGEVAQQRSAVLQLARVNAEKAASVVEAGGLDNVGAEPEPENEGEEANGNENAAAATTGATTATATPAYVAPTYYGGGGTETYGGDTGSTDTGGGESTPSDGGSGSTDTGGGGSPSGGIDPVPIDGGGGGDSGGDSGSDPVPIG